MIQQPHVRVHTQKNWKQELEQIFAHPVHSCSVHNSQEGEVAHVSMDGRMEKKMWSLHTMGYFSILKRKEILAQATRMNLEDIMLN